MRLRPISVLTNLRRLLELWLRQIRLYLHLFHLFHVPSCHLCPFPFLRRPSLFHGNRLGL
jgi:hypothetical protein